MAKVPKPTFKPLPYKVGTYWRVEVEWPDGVTQHVDDFGSESEGGRSVLYYSGSIAIEYRWARGQYNLLGEMAADLG